MLGQLVRGRHRVRGHDPRAEANGGEPDGDERRRVGQRQVHGAAWPGTGVGETAGGALDDAVELPVGPLGDTPVAVLEAQEQRLGVGRHGGTPHRLERDRLPAVAIPDRWVFT